MVAQPGLRGGDEFGERWHEGGMLGNKQNVFDDLYASAEWLIVRVTPATSGWWRLVATTVACWLAQPRRSARICSAASCSVPLLDMVRYHKFRIARYWIPEYGDPDKAADFALAAPLFAVPQRSRWREHANDAGDRWRKRYPR